MMLSPETLEAIHRAIGEEPAPRSRLLRRATCLVYALDTSVWSRRVDLCLVGGDPVALAARLHRAASECPHGETLRVAVLGTGRFSGAPIAALEDADLVASFVASRALPVWAKDLGNPPGGRVRAILARLMAELEPRIAASGIRGVRADDFVKAARPEAGTDIVLCLTRSEGVPRDMTRAPAERGLGEALKAGADSGGAALFDRSRALCREGLATLARGPLASFERVPQGARFADVLVARRVEVFSDFVSPGAATTDLPGVRFMEEELGAHLFRLARRVPASVAEALAMWRSDLVEAALGPQNCHDVNRRLI